MKRKLLSLLLVITLLAITVSTGLPTILAADENLFTNGDFADYSGYTPTGWKVSLNTTDGGASATVEKAKPDGVNEVNAVHIVTTKKHTNDKGALVRGSNMIYSTNTFKIEKNATYTITYWIKTNIGLTSLYMYEPNYINRDGVLSKNEKAAEGANIYSYSYDSGTTRVIRTDVSHSFKVAQSGGSLESGPSMSITRKDSNNNNPLAITPDFPAQEKTNEWAQVIHTFTTANLAAHEADVAYAIHVPSIEGGEFWVADFKANVVKSEIEDYYTPTVNNDTLGDVSKDVPLINGKVAEITADAYGENTFDGWFVDGELVSEDKTLTFTYDSNNPPKYEARFTKADWGIDGSFETGYTNGKLLAQSPDVAYDGKNDAAGLWTEDLFKQSSKDGNNMFFIDSEWAKWGNAVITDKYAHSGKYSMKMSPDSRAVGYKISGLEKNTQYSVSFYAMTLESTQDGQTIETVTVTDADMSCVVRNSNNAIVQRTVEAGALAKITAPNVDYRNTWQKVTVDFNSKDSTDIIVWVRPSKAKTVAYLDDYSIARAPVAFKPTVNDFNLGFASPAEGIVCVPGDEVTFKATPLEGNNFDGWYLGDEKISSDAEYTFTYSSEYGTGLTAHFIAGDAAVPNAGFETGYTNSQTLAQATHSQPIAFSYINQDTLDKMTEEEIKNWKTDWTPESWLATTKDGGNHYIETQNGGTYRKAYISSGYAHSGNYSLAFYGLYGYLGKKFTGLKKNTDYVLSFYSMISGSTSATIGGFKVTKTTEAIYNADGTAKSGAALIASSDKKFGYYDQWGKCTFEFNTGDNTDVIIWMYHNQVGTVYLDNFAMYEPINVNISADLGGTVTSNLNSNSVAKGTKVKVSATPLEGNTFAGWFDTVGNLVSSDAEYTFTADAATSLTAKFDGYNMPPRDHLATNGFDGTFESYANATMVSPWFANDPTWSSDWCSFVATDYMAYEGKQSLKVYARYRNSNLPLNGLVPNTDYRLTFYVAQLGNDEKAQIDSMGIIGEHDATLGAAATILNQRKVVTTASGWNKIDLYFNSGDNVNLKFILRYSTDLTDNIYSAIFIDNMSLYQYKAGDELVNGDFEDGKVSWVGGGANAVDGEANVFSLAANESIYQSVNVDAFSTYKVSFKAKGKLTAAAQDLAKADLNVKDYISSVSYIDAEGEEWTEYSYNVYSGIHEAMNLVFAAGDEGALIDDVTFTKQIENAGSVLEHIDFETERFELTSATDDSVYSIYTATEENDPYVHSGKKSLKFTYNELLSGADNMFNEVWLSYQPGTANNLKVSMKYKIVGGRDGGAIALAPEYSGTYGVEDGFEHIADNEEWQTITFYVNNSTLAVFKAKIGSVGYNTEADFYVDDIIISVAPPMVNEENSKTTYCERLYNAVDNEGFENAASNADWKNLPSTAKIVKGEAAKGTHFLRANAGTHYVLAVPVKAGNEYYFAASVRGTATTVGSIGVTVDKEGEKYFQNRDEVPASLVKFDSSETGWKRSGFKFTTDGSGMAYVVIDVESGALDIDSVMMFTSEYGYRYDPNDYTVYVPYDYDNLKSATTVINGGFGAQPYYKGDDQELVDDGSSPSTGDDSVAMPVMLIVLAVAASSVLMLIRKRKEGAENA